MRRIPFKLGGAEKRARLAVLDERGTSGGSYHANGPPEAGVCSTACVRILPRSVLAANNPQAGYGGKARREPRVT